MVHLYGLSSAYFKCFCFLHTLSFIHDHAVISTAEEEGQHKEDSSFRGVSLPFFVEVMQAVLPYTTNPAQMEAIEKLKLINPTSAAATGPYVNIREPKLVAGGLLHNWDAEAAQNLLNAPKVVQTWDLSWTAEETAWEEHVHRCTYPEEVEDLLPSKWIGYSVQSDVDETLARVCRLCTALVDKFIGLSHGNNANVSTAKWRQRQTLYDRLGAVMELLEASIGEAIPILKLKDPEFIHQCWNQMQEEERAEVMSALGSQDGS